MDMLQRYPPDINPKILTLPIFPNRKCHMFRDDPDLTHTFSLDAQVIQNKIESEHCPLFGTEILVCTLALGAVNS